MNTISYDTAWRITRACNHHETTTITEDGLRVMIWTSNDDVTVDIVYNAFICCNMRNIEYCNVEDNRLVIADKNNSIEIKIEE